MLFGFATAVIAGFLLTAVGNWTERATALGLPLVELCVLWLLGRVSLRGARRRRRASASRVHEAEEPGHGHRGSVAGKPHHASGRLGRPPRVASSRGRGRSRRRRFPHPRRRGPHLPDVHEVAADPREPREPTEPGADRESVPTFCEFEEYARRPSRHGRAARASTHLLRALGQERSTRQGDPGVGWAREPVDNASLHAPQPLGSLQCHRSSQRATRGRRGFWRHCGAAGNCRSKTLKVHLLT